MKKKLLFLVAISILCFACSDDNQPNIDDNQPSDNTCDENYVITCVDGMHYNVCKEGTIRQESCPNGTSCEDGECRPDSSGSEEKPECASDFKPQCIDNAHYKICQNGSYQTITCEPSQICRDGKCDAYTRPEICNDIGCACESFAFHPICQGQSLVTCQNHIVTEYDCTKDGLACYQGACTALGEPSCEPGTFQDKCLDNTYVYCDKSRHVVRTVRCDLDLDSDLPTYNVCATLNKQPGCFPVCSKNSVSDDLKYYCTDDFNYSMGQCVESDDHLYIVANTSDNMVSCNYGCYDGLCDTLFYNEISCDAQGFQALCVDNHAINCIDNTENYYDADNKIVSVSPCFGSQCVVNDNYAYCARPCESYEVGMTYGDNYCDNQTDINKHYTYQYTCTQTQEGYFWIENILPCKYCIDNQCVQEGTSCDPEEFESKCENNKIVECIAQGYAAVSDPNGSTDYIMTGVIKETDCGTNVCRESESEPYGGEWKPVCLETCSETEEGHSKSICRIYDQSTDYWDNPGYWSEDKICAHDNDDGNYYWVNDGGLFCYHSCNIDDGKCYTITDTEYKSCDYGSSNKYCKDDKTVMRCRVYSSVAESCAENEVCVKPDASANPKCHLACTQSQYESGENTIVCNNNIAEFYKCERNTNTDDGAGAEYYYTLDYELSCYLGCNEHGCIESQNPDLSDCQDDSGDRCDGNTAVHCNGLLASKQDCLQHTCAVLNEDSDCYQSCDSASDGKTEVICYGDFCKYKTCTKTEDNKYVFVETSEQCKHGYDDNGCIKIHPDEGKDCSDDFKPFCHNGYRMLCGYEGITAEECMDGLSCATINDEPVCAGKPCNPDDEKEVQLDCESEQYIEWICTPTDDGKNVLVSYDSSCDEASFKPSCCGGKIIQCYDHDVWFISCNKGASCKMIDEEPVCAGESCDYSELGHVTAKCTGSGHWDSVFTESICLATDDGEYVRLSSSQSNERCDGTVREHCNRVDNVVRFADCADEGKICAMTDGYQATCQESCQKSELGTVIGQCNSSSYGSSYYRTTRTCVRDLSVTNEIYYWSVKDNDYCSFGCDLTTNECIEIDNLGKACAPESSPSKCVGNNLVECRDNVIQAARCDDICALDQEGKPSCMTTGDSCDPKYFKDMCSGVMSYKCTRNDDTEPYQIHRENCSWLLDDGTCALTDTSEPVSNCVAESLKCTGDDTVNTCTEGGYYSSAYHEERVCTPFSDGNRYYSLKSYEDCQLGCNGDVCLELDCMEILKSHGKSVCIQAIPEDQVNTENETCNPDLFVAFCDGNTTVSCDYDKENDQYKVSRHDCETGSSCAVTSYHLKNIAKCIKKEDKCDSSYYGRSACIYPDPIPVAGLSGKELAELIMKLDPLDYAVKLETSECLPYTDRNYYWTPLDHYCSDECNLDVNPEGCSIISCSEGDKSECSGNQALYCKQMNDGSYQKIAMDCSTLYDESSASCQNNPLLSDVYCVPSSY